MADTQKYLDNLTGLPALWLCIGNKFVAKEENKGLSTEDFTTELKNKLDGIDTSADVNQNAFAKVKVGTVTIEAGAEQDTVEFAAGDNVTVTPDASGKKVTIAATDTTYDDVTADATGAAASGLMTSADKAKLDGVATGAEVNQNAYAKVKVGSDTLEADAKQAQVEFAAGTNVQLAADAGNGKVTISATDTTYEKATASADGLMSKEHFTKVEGLETGAQVNVIETVKVNGAALTPADKAVDVLIEEGATNGTIKANGTDVAVHGLGSAAYVDTEAAVANDAKVPTGAAVQTYVTGLGYQTEDDVQNLIDTAISAAYIFKGSVDDADSLPASGQKTGDVYNIVGASTYGPAGMNVAWNGSAWDALGASISIEAMTAADVQAICQ